MDSNDQSGSEYDLTEREYYLSLLRAEMGILMPSKSSENPNAFFIVAQPGAGKTGLKSYIINKLSDDNSLESVVELNPDNIGLYHEHYAEIMRDYPNNSFFILQKFIQPALDGYLRYKAVDIRSNILQEGTFANQDVYIDILTFLKNGGEVELEDLTKINEKSKRNIRGDYYIDINVLAVDRFESLLSSYEREQFFRDYSLPARIVQAQYHDGAYYKMLDTLDEIQRRKLADRIGVYKRGAIEDNPVLLWETGDNRFRSAREAISSFRAKDRVRIMSSPEQYQSRIDRLLLKAKDEQQIARIQDLQSEFEKSLESFRSLCELNKD